MALVLLTLSPTMLEINFYGVRGSTPCSGPSFARYGGNTSCVTVQVDGEQPLICDMGTGVRSYGAEVDSAKPFQGSVLLTHVHWDHILGMPFFGPGLMAGAQIHIVGPSQTEGTLREALARAVSPPLFPVGFDELAGNFQFQEVWEESFRIGSAQITTFPVRHLGPTIGYRIEAGSGSVVYISDHQQPVDGSLVVSPGLVQQCLGADVLIHDAQYSAEEFASRPDWGHSSVDFAVEVARAAGVKRLVMYHHDPAHDDDWIDEALAKAKTRAGGEFEVLASAEGMKMRSGI